MNKRVIESIDGSVQEKGIKVRFPGWMVIGSKEWDETSDEIRAKAYRTALKDGWTKEALIKAVCSVYKFIDEHTAKFTLELLDELIKELKE